MIVFSHILHIQIDLFVKMQTSRSQYFLNELRSAGVNYLMNLVQAYSHFFHDKSVFQKQNRYSIALQDEWFDVIFNLVRLFVKKWKK